MKSTQCLLGLGLMLVLIAAGGCDTSTSHNGDDISLVFQDVPFEAGLQKAKTDGKLVMVDFYADWCGPCKKLDAKTWPDAEVQEWLRANTVPMKINVDKAPDLSKKYKIVSIPALVFMKPDGTEAGRLEGFMLPNMFLKQARSLLSEIKAAS